MSDLTPAEARRFAVDGVEPYLRMRRVIAAGVEVRVLVYPAGSDIKDRLHPDDDAMMRAAVRAQVTAADIEEAGGEHY